MQKKNESWWSFAGVIALALVLPVLLRGVSYLQRVMVGAEGRLAAIGVEMDHPLGPLPQPWRALAQGGDQLNTFLDGKTGEVAKLKPEYIRIDHIYDGFNVVGRQSDGSLAFNWNELDGIVDKIASTGAKPFFSLSYMPLAISKSDILDQPKDWGEWALVVQKTIEHYSGDKNLAGVYYEVWNEPDLFGKWTMGGTKDYKTLYLNAARGANVAKVSQSFKLGGPGTTGLYRNWMDGFFPFILQNGLRLDFFSWHRYDPEVSKYTEDVTNVDKWLDSNPYFSQIEKIVTEMGPDSNAGGTNDNKIGAVHLLAASRELMLKAKYGFSFAVGGNFGVLNKPRGQALELLANLGENRLSVTGEGTWVTAIGAQKGNTAQVLVMNYDPKGLHSEIVPVTFLDLAQRNFVLKETFLGGLSENENVATTAASWQKEVPLTPNSAVLLELTPRP